MISASELDSILSVMKKHGTNVLRYKRDAEEIEIIIPTGDSIIDDDNEPKKNSSGGPRLNLIGFRADDDEDDGED